MIFIFSSSSNSFGHKVGDPFSKTGNDNDRYALGDIEFGPNKYAFLNEPERIVTGAFSIGLPNGEKNLGLGRDIRNWERCYLSIKSGENGILGPMLSFTLFSGPTENQAELAIGGSYSFIEGTEDCIAASRPTQ
jgi:hypothetical protein